MIWYLTWFAVMVPLSVKVLKDMDHLGDTNYIVPAILLLVAVGLALAAILNLLSGGGA